MFHPNPVDVRLQSCSIRPSITLLLCAQVWTASVYGALPSSASVYASTSGIFGSKSPLARFDRVHWSLVSGLVAVSAIYLWRERTFSARDRHLHRELRNSQAEISKLVMKVYC